MRIRLLTGLMAFLVTTIAITPDSAEGQLRRLRDRVAGAAERELLSQADRLVRDAIRCRIGDPRCYEEARDADEDVIFVDEYGAVIIDDDGEPITDRQAAARAAGVEPDAGSDGARLDAQDAQSAPARPGEGVWANYDFVPGDRILAMTDFSDEEVGDFPRELEFVRGTMEVVEWEGRRLLRSVASPSVFRIPMPDGVVPERFTVEIEFQGPHEILIVTEAPPTHGQHAGLHFSFGPSGSGVMEKWHTPLSVASDARAREEFVTGRIMVDERHIRAYVNETRVANIPALDFPRGEAIYVVVMGRPNSPNYVSGVRVAEGGRDLYDKLAAEGSVATQGILFDVDSDRIRPESTPTLDEIGTMLRDHPDLRISIQGHTDSTGDEAHNADLSSRRAESVRVFLIAAYGIDVSRLESTGWGESEPVDSNDTPAGRQNNRRVELVRLDG